MWFFKVKHSTGDILLMVDPIEVERKGIHWLDTGSTILPQLLTSLMTLT